MRHIHLKIIVENSVADCSLTPEHGLAYWIETPSGNILFDTGSSSALCHNAAILNIELKTAAAIVLSHGHYDHTGGIPCIAEQGCLPPVYLHPDALNAKYSHKDATGCRYIGMPQDTIRTLREREDTIIYTETPREICGGFHVTGAIPRVTDYEDTGGRFFTDQNCTKPDLLTDDIAGFFDTHDGLVVVLGCAHAGIINTLLHIRKLNPAHKIATVIGGMHLKNASQERIDRTAEDLLKLKIRRIYPLHCTGDYAIEQLKAKLGPRIKTVHAGHSI